MVHSFMQQTYVEPFLVPGQGVGTPSREDPQSQLDFLGAHGWAERRQTVNRGLKSLRTFVAGALEALWGSGELVRRAVPEKVCFHE